MTAPTPEARASLSERERQAHQALQAAMLRYLQGQGANPEQLAQSAYVQAVATFAVVQVLLDLVREKGIASPEILQRLIAEQYARTAAEVDRQPRITLARPQ